MKPAKLFALLTGILMALPAHALIGEEMTPEKTAYSFATASSKIEDALSAGLQNLASLRSTHLQQGAIEAKLLGSITLLLLVILLVLIFQMEPPEEFSRPKRSDARRLRSNLTQRTEGPHPPKIKAGDAKVLELVLREVQGALDAVHYATRPEHIASLVALRRASLIMDVQTARLNLLFRCVLALALLRVRQAQPEANNLDSIAARVLAAYQLEHKDARVGLLPAAPAIALCDSFCVETILDGLLHCFFRLIPGEVISVSVVEHPQCVELRVYTSLRWLSQNEFEGWVFLLMQELALTQHGEFLFVQEGESGLRLGLFLPCLTMRRTPATQTTNQK